MKRASLLAVFLCGAASLAGAAGKTGFEFLRLGGGPRVEGWGGAGVARLDGGLDGVFLNPASLAAAGRPEAWSSYAVLPGEVQFGEVAVGYPSPRFGAFSASLQHLSHDPIPAYNGSDGRSGTVGASDSLASLSWARTLSRRFSVGAGAKVFRESLDGATAEGRSVDLGVGWSDVFVPGFSLGAAVRNLGDASSFEGAPLDLPWDASVGAAHRAFGDALVVSLDVRRRAGASSLEVTAGGEYWLRSLMSFRLGYGGGRDLGPGASFGMGFKMSADTRLDYSFSPQGDLGAAHRFSLSHSFGGGRAAAFYQEGVRLMREGEYSEAVLSFDKALTLQPGHPTAARLLKEAGEKLREDAARTKVR